MKHPELYVHGYSGASMYVQSVPAPNVCAVISIYGRREFGVELPIPARLDLHFDDVDCDITPSRRKWNESNGKIEVPPTREDADAIIRFAESIRDLDGIVLCHCGMGVSRGPAAALICLAVWRGEGSEDDCVRELVELRRCAFPHKGLVKFADDLLKRNGKLLGAVKKGAAVIRAPLH